MNPLIRICVVMSSAAFVYQWTQHNIRRKSSDLRNEYLKIIETYLRDENDVIMRSLHVQTDEILELLLTSQCGVAVENRDLKFFQALTAAAALISNGDFGDIKTEILQRAREFPQLQLNIFYPSNHV